MRPGQAQRVIVVSLMKSGTHLLQELMTALGYKMYGAGVRLRPEILPVLDDETRWRIARLAYGKQALSALEAAGPEQFTEATDRAWDALGWSWHIRLAQPLVTWYSRELVDAGFVADVHRRSVGSDFADTPAGVCWVVNQFNIRQLDGHFLREWSQTGEPKIIFNYRDPRDVVLSMVNFLCDRTGRGFSNYNDFLVFSQILKSKESPEEQLAYALSDPSFPAQRDLAHMVWLLNHPAVCKTRFEDMVGPRGGGSAEAQARSLDRIFEFLGVGDAQPGDVAGQLFNPDVFSFYRGQIGGWREAFTPGLRRLADDRLGDLLRLYGYDQEGYHPDGYERGA
ncbi:MAG: hypothetical protein J2P25_16315 [Nocardiopsaceae bacterium]|nr:hypothetical protein [Nocardiopsaceae bacterium]